MAICQTAGDAFFIGEMETFGESRYLDFAPAIKRDDFGPIGFGDGAHLRRFRSLVESHKHWTGRARVAGSIPTAPTKSPVESVAFASQEPQIGA